MKFYVRWLVGTLIGLGIVTLTLLIVFGIVWMMFERPSALAILTIVLGCITYGFSYAHTAKRPKDVISEKYDKFE